MTAKGRIRIRTTVKIYLLMNGVGAVEHERCARVHEVRGHEAAGGGAPGPEVPRVLRGQCTESHRLMCQVGLDQACRTPECWTLEFQID